MDWIIYIKAIGALLAVLSFIGIIALFLKNFNFFGNAKVKELSVQEVLYITNKQKIILLKRKKTKYLILIADNQNLLIDTVNDAS